MSLRFSDVRHQVRPLPPAKSSKAYLVPGPKARLRQGTFEKPRNATLRSRARFFLRESLQSVSELESKHTECIARAKFSELQSHLEDLCSPDPVGPTGRSSGNERGQIWVHLSLYGFILAKQASLRWYCRVFIFRLAFANLPLTEIERSETRLFLN